MEEQQQLGAAAAAVFYTAELLESILKLLPMRDLLLDQRVCTHWRDAIKQSPELQQNLFFQPREATAHWLYTGNETEHMITQIAKDYASGQDEWVLPSGELNPLIFSVPKQDYYGTVLAAAQGGFEGFEFRYPRAFRHLCAYPDGSWRRMLVSQPPTRNWSYEVHLGVEGGRPRT
ncbi:hypothetical protein HII31_10698 [Pseudocercospora fuligena]|uniref:F-box domain-containing protein n=1 Tax=Pseudocercospora fuligena TaxID=685502 RepID=A0A8H6VD19_9PEZI|nr:hypothetical protein HII31_10698 [Pseudocercospora fuligena]